jgi:NAD(P)-dependent dehydrogenase (short-subunit alcohol dehydrogenase family)
MNSTPAALVTGGSRGIGRAICESLAEAGFNVMVNCATNRPAAEQTAAAVRALGRRAEVEPADVSVDADRLRLVERTLAALGRIDVLVNNAGIAPAVRADALEVSAESFDRVMGVNLRGPFFLTQIVAREMIRLRRAGVVAAPKIVNISSVSADTVSVNRAEYCISKAGLSMMTQVFAARLAAEGILVYEVRPGIVETDMTGPARAKYDAMIAAGVFPIARWGRADEVGRLTAALATGLLAYSTGEVIRLDGGAHIRRM